MCSSGQPQGMTLLQVILKLLLARISVFETVARDKLQVAGTVIRYRFTVLRKEKSVPRCGNDSALAVLSSLTKNEKER
ncbi:hypothetical protein RJ60_05765 [Mesotoga sp. B105.6.4]|nr:hypothetical protein RJ60_05765 [Mesotoga sp. B105.6.4]